MKRAWPFFIFTGAETLLDGLAFCIAIGILFADEKTIFKLQFSGKSSGFRANP